MAGITIADATSKLTDSVKEMRESDLIEVYGELFPERPTPEGDMESIKTAIFEYLGHGLEIEEILDLWNVVFPKDRDVYYDELTQMIQFVEGIRFAESTES
jgi:hypothetical protein